MKVNAMIDFQSSSLRGLVEQKSLVLHCRLGRSIFQPKCLILHACLFSFQPESPKATLPRISNKIFSLLMVWAMFIGIVTDPRGQVSVARTATFDVNCAQCGW